MRLVTCALCFLSTALAQTPQDVAGWGKIKWGMKVAEARVAYGDQVKPEGESSPYTTYPTKLRLENFPIGNGTGYVRIQTKKDSDIVCMVTLVASAPSVEEVPGQRAATFEQLKAMLVEKYGAPKNSDRKPSGGGSIATTVLWTFPSTSITLLWSDNSQYHTGYVTIEYKSVDKKALGTL